ncbi:MAG: hypothetical protein KJN63_04155, partial [Acidimicrobiia bacterium]|nr:hypothetical protein [Acidimicrobiia bacterium]
MTEPERSRLRRDQLKSLVLDAGLELLHEDGLGAKTAPIGYADAFRWLDEHRSLTLSRAQVHRRIWNSLAEYRQDVLSEMVRVGWPGDVLDATVKDVAEVIMQLDVADADADARLQMLCELARLQTDRNADVLRNRHTIAAADAVFAMHSLGTDEKPGSAAVRKAIIESRTEILHGYTDLYERVARVFGATPGPNLGLGPEEGMRVYAEILSCLNQGAAGRSAFEPVLQEIPIGGDIW